MFGYISEFLTRLYCLATQTAGAFCCRIILSKMLNNTTALLEQQPNIQAMLSTPLQEVDPILEIQSLYNIDQFTACDIYEEIGEDYTNEHMVACMFGIASPGYLAKMKGLNNLKGGVSC